MRPDRRGLAGLPVIPDLGEHQGVAVEQIPVEEGPDLLGFAAFPRDQFQLAAELISRESTDALLSKNPSTRSRAPSRRPALRRARRLHPVSQKSFDAHAPAVVSHDDLARVSRDGAK